MNGRRFCRGHLKRDAILEWDLSEPWLDDGPSLMIPCIDPLDFLPSSPEESIAWSLGLEVEDLPGWGTEVDLAYMTVYSI